ATPLSDIMVSRGTRPERDTTESILSNQTDLTVRFAALGLKHTLATGLEVARETFSAKRYTHANVPAANLLNPNAVPDTSRETKTTSARTSTTSTSFAIYAVDQIRLLPQLDLLDGLRFDLFATDFDSFLNNQHFNRTDTKVSPRTGLVF